MKDTWKLLLRPFARAIWWYLGLIFLRELVRLGGNYSMSATFRFLEFLKGHDEAWYWIAFLGGLGLYLELALRINGAALYPLLRTLTDPIPRAATRDMRENYAEMLPKAISMKTCYLSSRRFRAYGAADRIGLVSMLRSESLRRFAESITGLRLERAAPQVICYETGDYVGRTTIITPKTNA